METKEKTDFTQLCVWPATLINEEDKPGYQITDEDIKGLEKFFKEEFNVRIKFAERVFTNPTIKEGKPVKDSGGRSDLLFWVHSEDLSKFAIKRLAYGIRWWEDVVKYNDCQGIYSKQILDKYPITW